MRLELAISARHVCVIEIWEDRVPGFCSEIRRMLPMTSIVQHGKIVGDLAFFTLPLVLPLENAFPLQTICRERRRVCGSAAGAVCYYNPRQQICIYYGDDLADEPFEISYLGEIVDGASAMYLAGIRCWTNPGQQITMDLDRKVS